MKSEKSRQDRFTPKLIVSLPKPRVPSRFNRRSLLERPGRPPRIVRCKMWPVANSSLWLGARSPMRPAPKEPAEAQCCDSRPAERSKLHLAGQVHCRVRPCSARMPPSAPNALSKRGFQYRKTRGSSYRSAYEGLSPDGIKRVSAYVMAKLPFQRPQHVARLAIPFKSHCLEDGAGSPGASNSVCS